MWFVSFDYVDSIILPFYDILFYHFILTLLCYVCVFFLDCPKMYFQDFQKTHFFRYFLHILKFGPTNFEQVVILS